MEDLVRYLDELQSRLTASSAPENNARIRLVDAPDRLRKRSEIGEIWDGRK